MTISILLYSGLALLALGSVSLVWPPRFLGIATRLHALVVFGTGLVAATVAFLLPPPSARGSARAPTRIDEFAPGFQFVEFHERTVRATPERIAPGYAKAAMNFRIEPRPDGSCRLTTETRIFATDAASSRRFARYWRFILPGSSLLRVTWLRAIAERAERGR